MQSLRQVRGVRKNLFRVQTRRYAIKATVDKIVGVPTGYVPFPFTKEFKRLAEKKVNLLNVLTHESNMDMETRFSNPSFTAPFAPQDYQKVFGTGKNDAKYIEYARTRNFQGIVAVYNLAAEIVRNIASQKLTSAQEDKAWALFVRFCERVTEKDTVFGALFAKSTNPYKEARPSSYSNSHNQSIPLARIVDVNPVLQQALPMEQQAGAIDWFRAYVLAFERIASGSAQDIQNQSKEKVREIIIKSITKDGSTERMDLAKTLEEFDREASKSLDKLVEEYGQKLKEIY